MSWRNGILGSGISTALWGVGATHSAAEIQGRPLDWSYKLSMGGHFRLAARTGTIGAGLAAGSIIFAARWGAIYGAAVITRVSVSFMPLTAFTTGTLNIYTSHDMWISRDMTTNPTGGIAVPPTAQGQTLFRIKEKSDFTEIRIASTAAVGTSSGNVDVQPIGVLATRIGNRVNPATGTEETEKPSDIILDYNIDMKTGEHPIILGVNDAFLIRNTTVASWPAAGTGVFTVNMSWVEMPDSLLNAA
jgi:hypothetical protein